jgi:pyruvate,water dikinase
MPSAPPGPADPVLALYLGDGAGSLRRLAARVLDAGGQPAEPGVAACLLGPEAYPFLDPYLRYTRATHLDLLALAPGGPGVPPSALASLRAAEAVCGEALLRDVIAELGWPRINLGVEVRPQIGVSVGGSLPFWVLPAEALLLESCEGARRVADRFLVVAHGGLPPEGRGSADAADPVPRFRAYNLAHAEVLGDILDVAPLTGEKVRRILAHMDRIVEDFSALFARFSSECAILPAVYGDLKRRIVDELERHPADPQLSADLTRLVQMFEDPGTLGEVRTLHGLKRCLHQKGLKLGFRLVEAGRATNRTVDLALASGRRVLRAVRRIRYVDFDAGDGSAPPPVGGPTSAASAPAIPYPVAALADAFGVQLLHGLESFPDAKVFCYGNEVHYYVAFGNHPAFLRVDYAPPLQGGMIDLEYYGVSKYVLSDHPNPDLDALQAFFRRLDFDVQIRNTRVHARYDKERVLELGLLCEKAEAVFRLVPYLMDLDWVIADLHLSAEARRAVTEAWAARFEQWGVVPLGQVRTRDGRGILVGVESGPGGEREQAWTGEGEYRDRFRAVPAAALLSRVGASLAALDLGVPALPAGERADLGQIALERHLLRPVREAVARGELEAAPEGLRRRPPELFRREHEAEAFAAVLEAGGDDLAYAARLARLTVPLERSLHFRTTGSVNGYEVQKARLTLRGEVIGLSVLRDAAGMARLALFARGGTLWRRRAAAGDRWEHNRSSDAVALATLLRRNSYLPAGVEPAPQGPGDDAAGLRELLRQPNALVPLPPLAGEHAVTGLRVSSGRTAGTAVFGTAGRRPDDLDGAVLVAAAVRPEDSPYLQRAAGVVSTGGGTLSHAGLIAVQFHKPGLVVPGRWQTNLDGSRSLAYLTLEYTEEERTRGDWRVTVRRDLRESEHRLREGDLLVLDADSRTLRVLGQDRETLALHDAFRHFGDASRRLAGAGDEARMLELRGRRLRAAHQIRKLLGRLAEPGVARHAAQEILLGDALAGDAVGLKAQLLSILLANPRVAGATRECLAHVAGEAERRCRTARDQARRLIPAAGSLYEVLTLRLEALRRRRAHADVTQALRACGGLGGAARAEPDALDLDAPARARLESLRAETVRTARAAAPGGGARLRHLLRRIDDLDQVLGEPGSAEELPRRLRAGLESEDRAARGRIQGLRVLERGACGFEGFAGIGWKAANLGEVDRLAGRGLVPAWFVVTHHAFDEMLEARGDDTGAAMNGGAPEAGTLRQAIDGVLALGGLDEVRKAVRIRALWEQAPLPADLRREVTEAYRRLGAEEAPPEQGGDGDAGDPFVAVRSSAFEEDTEAAARAGEFDTFLFVRGEEQLLTHLKRAWSGLWTARAIHNRAAFGRGAERVGGGVIVQRMVDGRVSGVLQTVNLAEGEPREIVVNAGLGLGEGVVSGAVAADQVVVAKEGDLERGPLRFRYFTADKRERVVFDRRAGAGTVRDECLYHQRLRPALEYTELCELVGTAARLEAAYGYPLDIEFAIEKNTLRILQVRPVAAYRAALRETIEREPLPGPSGRSAPVPVEEIRP